jgi:hypothetical protein
MSGDSMSGYQYKVVAAPKRGTKVRGIKTTEDRFAYTLQELMNQHGAEGWEYLRADTLPCEERVGLTGRTTHFQNMLVFRKPIAAKPETLAPVLAEKPATAAAAPLAAPDRRVAETLSQPAAPEFVSIKSPVASPNAPELHNVVEAPAAKTSDGPRLDGVTKSNPGVAAE